MLVDGEPTVGENPVRMKRLKSYAEKAKEKEVSIRENLEVKEALLGRAYSENEVTCLVNPEIIFSMYEFQIY